MSVISLRINSMGADNPSRFEERLAVALSVEISVRKLYCIFKELGDV